MSSDEAQAAIMREREAPKATAALPKIALFRDWLLSEAADDLRRLRRQ